MGDETGETGATLADGQNQEAPAPVAASGKGMALRRVGLNPLAWARNIRVRSKQAVNQFARRPESYLYLEGVDRDVAYQLASQIDGARYTVGKAQEWFRLLQLPFRLVMKVVPFAGLLLGVAAYVLFDSQDSGWLEELLVGFLIVVAQILVVAGWAGLGAGGWRWFPESTAYQLANVFYIVLACGLWLLWLGPASVSGDARVAVFAIALSVTATAVAFAAVAVFLYAEDWIKYGWLRRNRMHQLFLYRISAILLDIKLAEEGDSRREDPNAIWPIRDGLYSRHWRNDKTRILTKDEIGYGFDDDPQFPPPFVLLVQHVESVARDFMRWWPRASTTGVAQVDSGLRLYAQQIGGALTALNDDFLWGRVPHQQVRRHLTLVAASYVKGEPPATSEQPSENPGHVRRRNQFTQLAIVIAAWPISGLLILAGLWQPGFPKWLASAGLQALSQMFVLSDEFRVAALGAAATILSFLLKPHRRHVADS